MTVNDYALVVLGLGVLVFFIVNWSIENITVALFKIFQELRPFLNPTQSAFIAKTNMTDVVVSLDFFLFFWLVYVCSSSFDIPDVSWRCHVVWRLLRKRNLLRASRNRLRRKTWKRHRNENRKDVLFLNSHFVLLCSCYLSWHSEWWLTYNGDGKLRG